MQLHDFKNSIKKKYKKRIGRGGKRGTTSGRGQKGQKSRAGRRIRPAERDLIIRIPKRRGFRNKPLKVKPKIFNLSDINNKAKILLNGKNNSEVNLEFLKTIRLVPSGFRGSVKILGDGEINIALNFSGLAVSKTAKAKIEKAGGRVIEAERRGSENLKVEAGKRGKVKSA
jgi:large subunit ribosomal protein L15